MIHLFNGTGLCWTESGSTKTGSGMSVSFSEQVRVNEIPSKESLSRRERRALWYSEPTRGSGKNLINQIMCGKMRERNGDGDEIDLDYDSDSRSFPVSAVLMEQESRRGSGQHIDPAEIAKIYQRCSSYSAVQAQQRATEFEFDAHEYLCQPSRHGRQKNILIEERREYTTETKNR
jgi:hypothetical protein